MNYYSKKLEIQRRAEARNRRVANIKLAVCAALVFIGFAVLFGGVIDAKFAARCENGAIVSELCEELK